jgi:hypothetical protein
MFMAARSRATSSDMRATDLGLLSVREKLAGYMYRMVWESESSVILLLIKSLPHLSDRVVIKICSRLDFSIYLNRAIHVRGNADDASRFCLRVEFENSHDMCSEPV